MRNPKVERLDPDAQGGFTWTVTFTSDNQDGDLPFLVENYEDITGWGATVVVSSVTEGSYLGGDVKVSFTVDTTALSDVFGAAATAEEVRVVLEGLGTGSLAVSREGDELLLAISNQDNVMLYR